MTVTLVQFYRTAIPARINDLKGYKSFIRYIYSKSEKTRYISLKTVESIHSCHALSDINEIQKDEVGRSA